MKNSDDGPTIERGGGFLEGSGYGTSVYNLRTIVVLSILERLQVPLGWCCSGCKAKEYTLTPGWGVELW